MKQLANQSFHRAYRELIGDRRRQMPFWMLAGFLPTYLIARLLVSAAPGLFLNIHGVHVHHFIYGIIVLAAVGFISLASPGYPPRPWLASLYGVGLALSFDEFGMWVHLTTNYNLDTSEDVMTGLLVLLVVIVYCTRLLRRTISLMRRR
jgi:hypothetical protein